VLVSPQALQVTSSAFDQRPVESDQAFWIHLRPTQFLGFAVLGLKVQMMRAAIDDLDELPASSAPRWDLGTGYLTSFADLGEE
jgi:hypothetical protein